MSEQHPPLDLDALQAMADACSPGPWIVMPEQCGPEGQGVYMADGFGPICDVGDPYPRGENNPQENMEFIAACREAMPALIAEVRRLRGIIQQVCTEPDCTRPGVIPWDLHGETLHVCVHHAGHYVSHDDLLAWHRAQRDGQP